MRRVCLSAMVPPSVLELADEHCNQIYGCGKRTVLRTANELYSFYGHKKIVYTSFKVVIALTVKKQSLSHTQH